MPSLVKGKKLRCSLVETLQVKSRLFWSTVVSVTDQSLYDGLSVAVAGLLGSVVNGSGGRVCQEGK